MDFGLYIIISNPVLAYSKIAEICVRQKIKYLQLREKDLDDRKLLAIAREIKSITKDSETKFIINDRADICLLSEADGLHLGQDDISFQDAVDLLPKGKIIGISTHNIDQALNALKFNPDYIGFGPIFKTPTKKKPDPEVGCDQLKQIITISHNLNKSQDIPIVAIGGIDENNICEIISTGAKNICMVRAFMSNNDFEKKIIKIKKYLERS
ncbi:MAG: thiamine phosphate synthase [Candidatus Cloacimonetes bacterium]|nr:thiamine phosphate synthase [Candidatus Cloacimonadota bacterium]